MHEGGEEEEEEEGGAKGSHNHLGTVFSSAEGVRRGLMAPGPPFPTSLPPSVHTASHLYVGADPVPEATASDAASSTPVDNGLKKDACVGGLRARRRGK